MHFIFILFLLLFFINNRIILIQINKFELRKENEMTEIK